MNLISEKTALPISLVLVLVGGVMWFTRLEAKVEAQAGTQPAQAELGKALQRIDRRLSRIEGKLSISGRPDE